MADFQSARSHFDAHNLQLKSSKFNVMLRQMVQSASLSWNKAPNWGLRPDFHYCQTVAGLIMWSALSDERTSLPFASQSHSHITTDGQSVCLGVEPRLGLMTRY
jgi:hypothetical protein